jgi:hypothetical protein
VGIVADADDGDALGGKEAGDEVGWLIHVVLGSLS